MSGSTWFWLAALCAVLGLAPAPLLAQALPDAGSVLREAERQHTPTLPAAVAAPVAAPASAVSTGGTTVRVQRFTFSGNRLLGNEALAEAVGPFLDRPLRLADLQAAAAAIAARYRAAGWLARAVLPQQEVTDGVVAIRIIEANFGQVRLQAPRSDALSPATSRLPMAATDITRHVQARQRSSEPLSLPALERGLLLAGDLPGVEVTGSLMSGADDGSADLLLGITGEPALSAELSADNHGARNTGHARVGARLAWAGPLGVGDEATLQLQLTPGIRYGRLGYGLPVGVDGLRASASVSTLGYRVRSDAFAALAPQGSADSVGVDASYPLVRAHDRNLYLTASAEHKRFDNRTALATTSRYRADNVALRLYGNRYDGLGQGGVSNASLGLTQGRVNLDGSSNQAADAVTAATQGRYSVLRYSLSRRQALGAGLTLFAGLSGQAASKNLDSSERFSLGGPNGVRAYPVNEGTGSEGRLVNAELRWRPASDACRCSVGAFYDWGQVKVHRNPGFAGAPEPNRAELRGFGASLNAALPAGLQLSAQLARRQGQNSTANPNGSDADGSLRKLRVWVSVSSSF